MHRLLFPCLCFPPHRLQAATQSCAELLASVLPQMAPASAKAQQQRQQLVASLVAETMGHCSQQLIRVMSKQGGGGIPASRIAGLVMFTAMKRCRRHWFDEQLGVPRRMAGCRLSATRSTLPIQLQPDC